MKRLCVRLLIAIAVVPSALSAETIYVTDQLTVPLRSDPIAAAPVVKTVPSGTALDLVEQGAGFARVRDPQGIEGWIETTSIMQRPPAVAQVKGLRTELERARSQLAQLQAQVDKGQSGTGGTAQPQAEVAALQAQLAHMQEELKKKDEQLSRVATTNTPAPNSRAGRDGEGGFSFLWLGLAFAMLGLGFVGGIIWVRESIRRRMGGMYLRI